MIAEDGRLFTVMCFIFVVGFLWAGYAEFNGSLGAFMICAIYGLGAVLKLGRLRIHLNAARHP